MALILISPKLYERREITKKGSQTFNYYAIFTDSRRGKRRRIALGNNRNKAEGQLHIILALDFLRFDFDDYKNQTRESLIEYFAPRALDDMRRPCIYIVRRKKEVLYVGRSARGLSRPFDPRHHAIGNLTGADVEAQFFITTEEAEIAEARLIRDLKPTLNIVGVA